MKAKDIIIGEEYLVTSSKDNRYSSDRRRARVVEAPVASPGWNQRKDSALLQYLDMDTGEEIDADSYRHPKIRRLADIRMLWADWLEQERESNEIKARNRKEHDELLAERTRKLEALREAFGGVTLQKAGGRHGSSHPNQVFTSVTMDIDELYDWVQS